MKVVRCFGSNSVWVAIYPILYDALQPALNVAAFFVDRLLMSLGI
jgi:hypothetical protein